MYWPHPQGSEHSNLVRKIRLQGTDYEDVEWIRLAVDNGQYRAISEHILLGSVKWG